MADEALAALLFLGFEHGCNKIHHWGMPQGPMACSACAGAADALQKDPKVRRQFLHMVLLSMFTTAGSYSSNHRYFDEFERRPLWVAPTPGLQLTPSWIGCPPCRPYPCLACSATMDPLHDDVLEEALADATALAAPDDTAALAGSDNEGVEETTAATAKPEARDAEEDATSEASHYSTWSAAMHAADRSPSPSRRGAGAGPFGPPPAISIHHPLARQYIPSLPSAEPPAMPVDLVSSRHRHRTTPLGSSSSARGPPAIPSMPGEPDDPHWQRVMAVNVLNTLQHTGPAFVHAPALATVKSWNSLRIILEEATEMDEVCCQRVDPQDLSSALHVAGPTEAGADADGNHEDAEAEPYDEGEEEEDNSPDEDPSSDPDEPGPDGADGPAPPLTGVLLPPSVLEIGIDVAPPAAETLPDPDRGHGHPDRYSRFTRRASAKPMVSQAVSCLSRLTQAWPIQAVDRDPSHDVERGHLHIIAIYQKTHDPSDKSAPQQRQQVNDPGRASIRRRMQLRGPEGQMLPPAEELALLEHHFSSRFRATNVQDCAMASKQWSCREPIEIHAATLCAHILQVPRRKAVPAGHPPSATWRICADLISPWLCNTLRHTWHSAVIEVPQAWANVDLALVPKPEKSGREPKDYRPIGLACPLGKKMLGVIVQPYVTSIIRQVQVFPQFAYQQGRSQLAALRRVFQHCASAREGLQLHTRNLHLRFAGHKPTPLFGALMVAVDLTQAFDRMPRHRLYQGLCRLGVPTDVAHLLMAWHSNIHYRVHHNQDSRSFRATRGIRQGCSIAPLLWLVFSHEVSCALEEKVGMDTIARVLTIFADDYLVADTFSSVVELEALLDIVQALFRTLETFGMEAEIAYNRLGSVLKGRHHLSTSQRVLVYIRWRSVEMPECPCLIKFSNSLCGQSGLDMAVYLRTPWMDCPNASIAKNAFRLGPKIVAGVKLACHPDISTILHTHKTNAVLHEHDELFGSLAAKQAKDFGHALLEATTTSQDGLPSKAPRLDNGKRGRPQSGDNQPSTPFGGGGNRQRGGKGDRGPRSTQALLKTMGRLLLRQETSIQILKQNSAWDVYLQPGAQGPLPLLFRASETYRAEAKSKRMDCPLRAQLLSTLFQTVLQCIKNIKESPEQLQAVQTRGWITSEGRWVYQRWDPQAQVLAVDEGRTPLEHQELVTLLGLMAQAVSQKDVVHRFNATYPITVDQRNTARFMLEIGLRAKGVGDVWIGLEALQGLAALQVVGMQLRRDGLRRSNLAEDLQKMLNELCDGNDDTLQGCIDRWHQQAYLHGLKEAYPVVLMQLPRYSFGTNGASKDRSGIAIDKRVFLPIFGRGLTTFKATYLVCSIIVHHGVQTHSGHYTSLLLEPGALHRNIYWGTDDGKAAKSYGRMPKCVERDAYVLILIRCRFPAAMGSNHEPLSRGS
ncbi:unnamed protein product [Symbiodinium microadriaticum]|nr:unnamed protein product [Symbiodinium microadriaticum]